MYSLETKKLCKSFGALTVADHIDFRLEPGARHALIGPNGAGKTTFINMLMGALAPSSGQILLGGEDVTRAPQSARVRGGLGRTFQITTLFRSLPVLDNVALAVAERSGIATRLWRAASAHKEVIEESRGLLEIALALATRPRVLLLDEPAAGVPRGESAELFAAVEGLSSDLTVLFIEHDMDVVFRFASRILVEGAPQEIARDERVREVYLGAGHAA